VQPECRAATTATRTMLAAPQRKGADSPICWVGPAGFPISGKKNREPRIRRARWQARPSAHWKFSAEVHSALNKGTKSPSEFTPNSTNRPGMAVRWVLIMMADSFGSQTAVGNATRKAEFCTERNVHERDVV
jgi:hypothetical protein